MHAVVVRIEPLERTVDDVGSQALERGVHCAVDRDRRETGEFWMLAYFCREHDLIPRSARRKPTRDDSPRLASGVARGPE